MSFCTEVKSTSFVIRLIEPLIVFVEGFPNALIEAMSIPLACISTDFLSGDNEIIQNGINGLMVPTGSVVELTKALDKLMNDKDLRNKLAANAYAVREKLAFENIANQYLNFITKND